MLPCGRPWGLLLNTGSAQTDVGIVTSPTPTPGAIAPAPPQRSAARFFSLIFVPLVVIYLATASWERPYGADPGTNVLTAYELATDGDVFLDDHEQLAAPPFRGRLSWVVPAGDSAASQYPPGAAILAVPLYAVWPGDVEVWEGSVGADELVYPLPPIAPAAITTALAAAAGVALLGLAIRKVSPDRIALLAAYTIGLATGVWSVAADKLWLHTADVLYMAAGMWLSARFYLASGLSFGLAILTRPHTAIVAAGVGLGRGRDQLRWRPVLTIGAGAACGLAALVVFNSIVFGSPSITGGYGIAAAEFIGTGRVDILPNVWGALFDGRRGLFVYSPFLLLLLAGLGAAWKAAPNWVRGSALGGLAYLLIQLASNRFSGGNGFTGYRYPIEAIVAAAPLLTLAYLEWVAKRPLAKRLLVVLIVLSVEIQAIGAIQSIGCAATVCF